MTFTLVELWREAQRETALRRNVYQHWVVDRRMSQLEAEEGIGKMQAIADLLEPMAKQEQAAIDAEREINEPRFEL